MTAVLNGINNPAPRKLNILCCPTHEGQQTMMSKTGHNFYMVSGQGIKTWDFHTRKLPENFILYNLPLEHMRGDIPFDLILSNERLGQLPQLMNLSMRSGVPVVHLEHTERIPRKVTVGNKTYDGWTKQQFKQIIARRPKTCVFITEHNRRSWEGLDTDVVIPHGIDHEVFDGYTGENSYGIACVNLYKERDMFCGWSYYEDIVKSVQIKLIGHNPGLSQSVNNVDELVREFSTARFFLNTSTLSPVPLSLLEAMCCGCPPVSTANQEVPKIIKHGENGFLFKTAEEAVGYCKQLQDDPELARKIGAAARQTIIEKFNIGSFVQKWNKVFYENIRN